MKTDIEKHKKLIVQLETSFTSNLTKFYVQNIIKLNKENSNKLNKIELEHKKISQKIKEE